MKTRLIPAPFRHRITGPDVLGFIRWQHIQDESAGVYERTFTNEAKLFEFLADRYGRRFENKIRAEMEAFK